MNDCNRCQNKVLWKQTLIMTVTSVLPRKFIFVCTSYDVLSSVFIFHCSASSFHLKVWLPSQHTSCHLSLIGLLILHARLRHLPNFSALEQTETDIFQQAKNRIMPNGGVIIYSLKICILYLILIRRGKIENSPEPDSWLKIVLLNKCMLFSEFTTECDRNTSLKWTSVNYEYNTQWWSSFYLKTLHSQITDRWMIPSSKMKTILIEPSSHLILLWIYQSNTHVSLSKINLCDRLLSAWSLPASSSSGQIG